MGLTSFVIVMVSPTSRALASASSGRYRSLDALRGLLASSVLVHHAYIARRFYADGSWVPPESNVYHFAGGGAVAMFFMITGLLFWGKALDGTLRVRSLLLSRVRRIMPLYLFSLLVILVLCAVISGFSLRGTPDRLALSLFRWATGGLLGQPPINGVPVLMVNAGVTWTLQYEWVFYLLLPGLAMIFLARRRFLWLAVLALPIVFLLKRAGHDEISSALAVALPFLAGMLGAYLVRSRARDLRVEAPWVSCGVVLNLAVVAWAYRSNLALLGLALTPAFIAIALGNSVFGLLHQTWVRWLGHISFSIYLLHGIVLLTCLRVLASVWRIPSLTDGAYIAVSVGVGALVVVISSLTYLWIERRFIRESPSGRAMAPSAA